MSASSPVLGVGVVGLGRAFTLMLPTFCADARFRLVAATTPDPAIRAAFERDFSARSYDSIAALCEDPDIDLLYIASPHQFHCDHVTIAAAAGKHMLVDKPLAITLDEAERMVQACRANAVTLIVGPSHSFDAPVAHARTIIAGGEYGDVRMIHALNYTDFLYRPRRPEELDTRQGGGVVFSQAIHQIDIVRLLGGGDLMSVKAHTGNWDAHRPTEGAYSALMAFQQGAFASLSYSGYGRFDSDALMDWIGELGRSIPGEKRGGTRRRPDSALSPDEEAALKRSRNYGHVPLQEILDSPPPDAHEHFGLIIVSCDQADLRLKADGIELFTDSGADFIPLPLAQFPRKEVMDEAYGAIVHGISPVHSVGWGLASLEAALAILESSATGDTVYLQHQQPFANN